MAREFYCSNETTVVQTAEGKLKGYYLDGIFAFQGIEYAYADRWQMPVPPKSWEGIKDATNYGYICPTMGEPALWTPTLDPQAKKPVLVWLHGGGYANGSSIEQVSYEGDALAEYGDVVVITVNHRLNILGFLDMSSFGEKYANSVNAGMADLVECLRWVKRNVGAFGGDPDNVTIFGQSGGGGKVETLMQIPEADGLFQKGIIMSGLFRGLFTPPEKIGEQHRKLVLAILKELSIPEEEVSRLETVPYDVLERAYNKAQYKLIKEEDIYISWNPVPNEFYVGDPMIVGFTEHAKTVPVIAGTVFGEFTCFGPMPDEEMPEEAKMAMLQKMFGEETDELIRLFKKAYPDKDITRLALVDAGARGATNDFIEAKARVSSVKDYLYTFVVDFDVNGRRPAWHCADISFVFYNTHRVPSANIEEVTDLLEDEVAGAVTSFARSSDPNHPGMRKWEAYSDENPCTMVFDEETACRKDYDRELIRRIEEIQRKAGFQMISSFKQGFVKRMESGEGGDWIY